MASSSKLRFIVQLLAVIALFAVLGVVGTTLYYGQIIPAAQNIGSFGLLPIFGFSLIAGALAFFAPCPVSVFPAYVGLFIAGTTKDNGEGEPSKSFKRALQFGLVAAFGIILFYAVVGGVLAILGTATARYVLQAKLPIVILIGILGLLLLFDVRIPTGILDQVSQKLGKSVRTSSSEFTQSFLYGVLYAIGGAACFLPLLLTIALTPMLTGNTLAGFVAFLGYGVALGSMLVLATLLVEQGRTNMLHALIGRAALLKRIAGGLLLLAALVMGFFYITTGM